MNDILEYIESVKLRDKDKEYLKNPKTIQDKLRYLAINDLNETKIKCADKLLVKDYILEKTGEKLFAKVLYSYDKIDDMTESDFKSLPNKFVVKGNQGWHMMIVVKDKSKITLNKIKERAKDWHTIINGIDSMEFQYSFIKKKVFIEEYLGDNLIDYRFWCFNGEPRFIAVNTPEGYGMGPLKYYDLRFKELNMVNSSHYQKDLIFNKPNNLNKMIDYTKKIAKEHKFVRVDFFNISGKIYISELTFTPGGYTFHFFNKDTGENMDLEVGKMLHI